MAIDLSITKDDFTLVDGQIVGREDLFEEKLAEHTELTVKQLKAYDKFSAAFISESVTASGELAQDVLDGDDTLDDLAVVVKMYGRAKLEVRNTRAVERRIPRTGEKITVRGSTRLTVSNNYSLETGVVGAARAHLKTLAAERWGKES